eukprot:TCALIF_05041-PA protein Name:"Similar to AGAP000470 Probable methylthioribulose-1-phosphate dehydratase (Anopheles gambiae)" AED:0.14 eAED:0.14 QI:199/0.75/0.6/1/1/1/5/0/447
MSPPTRVNAGGASAGGVGHSSTSAGSAQDLFHALHPRRLIPELCHLFYHQGWFSGTGGGVSIKQGSNIYVAPSGVQKERLEHDDLFLLKGDGSIAQSPPQEKNLSLSQCTPLFMNAYQERNANAGIHHPLENRAFRYDEEIIVPIIENTCFEADLKDSMLDAMKRYPTSNAVMVRRHGIYVWGKSWQQCKAMAECYHYLCEMAVEMERLGINEYTHHNEAIVPTVLSKPITPVTPKAESTPAPNSTATVPDTPKTPVAKDNGTTSNGGTPHNKPAASPKKTPNTEGKAKLNGVKGGKVTKPKNNKQQGNKWNNRKSPAGARGGPGGPGGSGGPQMGGVPSPWGPPIPGLMGMGPMMGPMGPMMPPHPGMFGPGGPSSGGQNSGGRNGRGGGRGGGSGRGRGSKKQGGATTPKNTNDKNKTPNQRGGGAKGRGRGNKLGMSKNTIMNY